MLKSCGDVIKSLIYPLDYQHYVIEYAGENGLEPSLVLAIIKVESNYISDAHSGKASGLMQITDSTADWIAGKLHMDSDKIDLMEPEDNIKMGCYYIRYLIDYYKGNTDVALAAYNGGMGNVNQWLEDKRYSSDGKTLDYIPFKETREYVRKVYREQKQYEELLRKEREASNILK